MSTQPAPAAVRDWPARDAAVIDATWDENSGSPEHRIAVIAQRARDAGSISRARRAGLTRRAS
jgi:hypothetical protein